MSNHHADDQPQTSGQVPSPIIIGLDFGASHTAAAYVVLSTCNNNPEPIILDKWPSAYSSEISKTNIRIKSKISTALHYDQYQKVRGWGEEDDVWSPGFRYLKPGFQYYDHFKYNFAPLPNSRLQNPPRPPGKTVEDAMIEFLNQLRKNVLKQIAAELDSTLDVHDIEYVVTVPASWNEETLSRFTALTKEAGFPETGRNLTLVPGTEAIMLQTLSNNPSNFNVGDCILVADFGGHIVEMLTYEIKSKDPWRMEPCTNVSAEPCGVSQAKNLFSDIIRDRKKKMNLPLKPMRFYAKHCHIFAHEVVSTFGNPGLVEPHIWDSRNTSSVGYFKFETGIEADFPDADIVDGYMWYSYEEMESCFEPVVGVSLSLFDEQVAFNEACGRALKACVMVGGSLITPYVLDKILSGLKARGMDAIRPDISLTCVKGAVAVGLERHGKYDESLKIII